MHATSLVYLIPFENVGILQNIFVQLESHSKSAKVVSFLICIWEIHISNIGRATYFLDWELSWIFSVFLGKFRCIAFNWVLNGAFHILSNSLLSARSKAYGLLLKALLN
jgi:hypothetical protein